jgi:hypothetical protein
MTDDLAARIEAIFNKHIPERGEYLGTVEYWGLDVYDGSPQEWKDALIAEYRQQQREKGQEC